MPFAKFKNIKVKTFCGCGLQPVEEQFIEFIIDPAHKNYQYIDHHCTSLSWAKSSSREKVPADLWTKLSVLYIEA
jgi:hypothetical protein